MSVHEDSLCTRISVVYTGECNGVVEHSGVMYSGDRVHTQVLSMKENDLSQPTDSLAKA